MNRLDSDGLCVLSGIDVYVKDGRVRYIIDGGYIVYPYRWSHEKNCWVLIKNLTLRALCAGLSDGKISIRRGNI